MLEDSRVFELCCHLRQAIFNLPTKALSFFFGFVSLNLPLPPYSLFQAQSEPPGLLGPLICMTGIGKSSAELQTAAGRQPVF